MGLEIDLEAFDGKSHRAGTIPAVQRKACRESCAQGDRGDQLEIHQGQTADGAAAFRMEKAVEENEVAAGGIAHCDSVNSVD